eukprot:347276-Chlamydomonas_euryale.AAC.2
MPASRFSSPDLAGGVSLTPRFAVLHKPTPMLSHCVATLTLCCDLVLTPVVHMPLYIYVMHASTHAHWCGVPSLSKRQFENILVLLLCAAARTHGELQHRWHMPCRHFLSSGSKSSLVFPACSAAVSRIAAAQIHTAHATVV